MGVVRTGRVLPIQALGWWVFGVSKANLSAEKAATRSRPPRSLIKRARAKCQGAALGETHPALFAERSRIHARSRAQLPCVNPPSFPHLSARSVPGLHNAPPSRPGAFWFSFQMSPQIPRGLSRSECDPEWVARCSGAQDPCPPEIGWGGSDRDSQRVRRTAVTG